MSERWSGTYEDLQRRLGAAEAEVSRLTGNESRLLRMQVSREKEIARLTEERDELGDQLAQERSRPGGSFDQWDRLQRTEQERNTLFADNVAAEAENRRLREGLRWFWACVGEPQWFGDTERARLRALLAGSPADAARVPEVPAGEPDDMPDIDYEAAKADMPEKWEPDEGGEA